MGECWAVEFEAPPCVIDRETPPGDFPVRDMRPRAAMEIVDYRGWRYFGATHNESGRAVWVREDCTGDGTPEVPETAQGDAEPVETTEDPAEEPDTADGPVGVEGGGDDFQPRFRAYALAEGRTPEEQLAHDTREYPGGPMTGYVVWIEERAGEFNRRKNLRAASTHFPDQFTTHCEAFAARAEGYRKAIAAKDGPTTAQAREAEAFRAVAEDLRKRAEDNERPRRENTPKQQKQAAAARFEASNYRHAADAAEAIAEGYDRGTLPPELKAVRPTRAGLFNLTRRRRDHSAERYYDVVPTDQLADASPLASILRAWVDSVAKGGGGHGIGTGTKDAATLAAENEYRDVLTARIPGFFPTPEAAARRMVSNAFVKHGDRVLEPSAGRGDLAEAIAEAVGVGSVDVCEINPRLRGILARKWAVWGASDFLEVDDTLDGRKYDAVVMNPPFQDRQDAAHIMHAFKFVRRGGCVVALCSPALFFASDKRAERFREWFNVNDGERLGAVDGFAMTNTRAEMIRIPKEV